MKRRFRWPKLRIRPTFQFLLLTLLFFGASTVPPILLFDYSPVLGYWWTLLLALYYGSITTVYIHILLKREKVWIRQQLGDEQFFQLFPGEKRRLERERLREQQRRAEEREAELRKRGL